MKNQDSKNKMNSNRRQFLQMGTLGVGALLTQKVLGQDTKKRTLSTSAKIMKNKPLKKLWVGFVGVGMQGSGHVRNFLKNLMKPGW